MTYRTDKHNNPTAFTIAVAQDGGLIEGTDYEQGDSFIVGGQTYYTAKLLGDPIDLTTKVIDKIGFYTLLGGHPRWVYISMPQFIWSGLSDNQKRDIIGFMYRHEGGTEMISLFPNYHES